MTKLPVKVRASASVGSTAAVQCNGIYQGSVVSNSDPLNQSRVKVQVPQILGTAISDWALPVGFSSLTTVPVVGQLVNVWFLGGNRNLPAYAPLSWPQAANMTVTGNLVVDGTSSFAGLATFNASPPLKVSTGAAQNSILVSDASGNMTQKLPVGNILTTYCGPASSNGTTVTSTSTTTIASMTVAANDPIVGAIYELEVNGNGSWPGTGQTLEFIATYGGNQMTNLTLGAQYFSGNQNFRWKMRTRVYCVSTGANGTWTSELDGVASVFSNNILTQAGSNLNGSTGFVSCESSGTTTVSTTAQQTLELQVNWGGSGGSISSQVIIPKRLA